MIRSIGVLGAVLLVGCGLLPDPSAAEPVDEGGSRISFAIPESWVRLGETVALHYFTTGDPDVCANVVGGCDPTTYVMESGTMDVAITPIEDESGCAEEKRPTWDARVEARAPTIREATYRLSWSVCYPGSDEAVQIAADLRTADLAVRDELLGQLRGFVESVVLIHGGGQFAPEK
ncbi:MAG: hypothetical protein H0W17_04025 [Chloroflexi bacterium]|nr:hypothetical protein [Chloroflexota bacterium]